MVSRGVAIVSGSGGVGRTTIAANLASRLARAGHRTLLIDLCFGWGGLNDFALDLHTFEEVLDSDGRSIISSSEYCFDLITSIPIDSFEFENNDIKKLAWVLSRACSDYEQIIFDPPSGGHPLALLAAGMSSIVYLVARPDSVSFGSAYNLLKALHLEGINSRVRVVFNQVESAEQAASLKTMFDLASGRFLDLKILPGGHILYSSVFHGGDFCSSRVNRSSQLLLDSLKLPEIPAFQDETEFNSILNTFPYRLNQRR